MKISISLRDEDLEFVDAQTKAGVFPSRSAAFHAALVLLRDRQYVDSYAAAWDEWDAAAEQDVWDSAIGDGIR
jgi:Arc/MetJ-type ribon-helix-helix transcriptional regulator